MHAYKNISEFFPITWNHFPPLIFAKRLLCHCCLDNVPSKLPSKVILSSEREKSRPLLREVKRAEFLKRGQQLLQSNHTHMNASCVWNIQIDSKSNMTILPPNYDGKAVFIIFQLHLSGSFLYGTIQTSFPTKNPLSAKSLKDRKPSHA